MKICFGDQIHRLAGFPEDFNALCESIRTTYNVQLPSKWTLYYFDPEGDRILLRTEHDFQVMIATLPKGVPKVLKVYIVRIGSNNQPIFPESKNTEKEKGTAPVKDKNKEDTLSGDEESKNDEDKAAKLQKKINDMKEKLANEDLSDGKRTRMLGKLQLREFKLQRLIEKREKKQNKLNKKKKGTKGGEEGAGSTTNVGDSLQELKEKIDEDKKVDSKQLASVNSVSDEESKNEDKAALLQKKINEMKEKLANEDLSDGQKTKLFEKLQLRETKLQRILEKREKKQNKVSKKKKGTKNGDETNQGAGSITNVGQGDDLQALKEKINEDKNRGGKVDPKQLESVDSAFAGHITNTDQGSIEHY